MAVEVKGSNKVKSVREELEAAGFYDPSRRIMKTGEETFTLPVNGTCVAEYERCSELGHPLPSEYSLSSSTTVLLPASKQATARTNQGYKLLQNSVAKLFKTHPKTAQMDHQKLLGDLPRKWERHGDMVVLPSSSFSHPDWKVLPAEEPWRTVAVGLRCRRLAMDTPITCDCFRSSGARVLLGSHGWVERLENGVKYVFDVTKCMFSSGNISEKIRVAAFDCTGETVVDLYAGIGYFTLPYLVHSGAARVHACEWNSHAVEALKKGLAANHVEGKCTIHFGDCRKAAVCGVADRVSLGLLPSSEAGWGVACTALKEAGGWLHIHGNVNSKAGGTGERESNPWEHNGEWERNSFEEVAQDNSGRSLRSEMASKSQQIPITTSDTEELPQKVSVKAGPEGGRGRRRREERWWAWAEHARQQTRRLIAAARGREWCVSVRHLEHVKSFAPHVDHLVVDLYCRPQGEPANSSDH